MVLIRAGVINRNLLENVRYDKNDIYRYNRNPDPSLHPFERAREYTRALNAAKLEKLFAKPFIGSLDGHTDSVKSLTRCHKFSSIVASGSCDGEVKIWDLSGSKCLKSLAAHDGFVRGIAFSSDDTILFSCGDDKLIKQWSLEIHKEVADMNFQALNATSAFDSIVSELTPKAVFQANTLPTSLDTSWNRPLLISTGETLDVWDYERSLPVQSFEWGCESLYAAKLNPSEGSLVVSTAADNSIGLYDIRGNSPIRKIILKLRSNAVDWNPQQPLNFTVANEDCNLYTWDLRKLNRALRIHKDFVGPVLDVNYSPAGNEFVAGSADKTIRIFQNGNQGSRSRDVYHTKRMQTVLAVAFSADSRFVLSGSADMCLRLWKAKASAPLGTRSLRERTSLQYQETLMNRFGDLQEIKRIRRHRHVPKIIKTLKEKKSSMLQSSKRKEENRRKHSKPGSVPFESALVKPILQDVS